MSGPLLMPVPFLATLPPLRLGSDVPTKQFILSLDTRLACVVSDLDATHVFVKKESIKEIK